MEDEYNVLLIDSHKHTGSYVEAVLKDLELPARFVHARDYETADYWLKTFENHGERGIVLADSRIHYKTAYVDTSGLMAKAIQQNNLVLVHSVDVDNLNGLDKSTPIIQKTPQSFDLIEFLLLAALPVKRAA